MAAKKKGSSGKKKVKRVDVGTDKKKKETIKKTKPQPTISNFLEQAWDKQQIIIVPTVPGGNVETGRSSVQRLPVFKLIGCYRLLSNTLSNFYSGFSSIADLSIWGGNSAAIEGLGMLFHYNSLSRGVIDVTDIAYFVGLIFMLLLFTNLSLNRR